MPSIPNLRRPVVRGPLEAAPPPPATFVDTPAMDYAKWLDNAPGGIATFGAPAPRHVVVVGSGAAGLSAAFELVRCGMEVMVYEATDRIGGRLFSSPSSTGDGNLFEMGAMRFSPSEAVLHHYADVFNRTGPVRVVFDPAAFPDPGQNLTYVAFKGKTYVYSKETTDAGMPPSFKVVGDSWDAFMKKGFHSADGKVNVEAADVLTGWLAAPAQHSREIHEAWQGYIDAFENSTLQEAVVRIFTDANVPGGTRWSQTDLEFFGALGTGFGGFGPLFPIGFLDIMRFVVNAVDSEHHQITTGVKSVVDGFLDTPIRRPDGTITTLRKRVVTKKPVSAIQPSGTRQRVTFADGSSIECDRVVVATSHRSMELTMGLGVGGHGQPLAEPVADAVRRLHLENSSKVFAEVKRYWTDPKLPRNVVGDTTLRNLYTLTYPAAPAATGVLLFSYTWADDSVKQQTFKAEDRIRLLERDLDAVQAGAPAGTPSIAAAVRNAIIPGTAQVIDWQSAPYFFGAFKLAQPGQDVYAHALFYDFLKAGTPADTGVYLAGDSVGFLGGWVENALQTGVNAAAAVAVSMGGKLAAPELSPFHNLNPREYRYDVLPGTHAATRDRVAVPSIVGGAEPAQHA